jgi:hypothetical protein
VTSSARCAVRRQAKSVRQPSYPAGLIPDATLRIYPDAPHASLLQYPQEAAADVNTFLG